MREGRTIGGRYRLRQPLGSGGMSVVWRADDELLGREVAIKMLSADVAANPAALDLMYAEARAAANLHHENVVRVHDYGEAAVDGVPVPYVVMELVEGRSLDALLTGGPLPWRLAVLIGAQVAAALAAAHDRGVVHRDVKPANVMVTPGGVKLVDFGISAVIGEQEAAADSILGTPAYLAPERLVGGMVRPATDVYAFGLLLYMALAGRMPWNASTTTQMLRAHRYHDPAPLPGVPELPAEVADLVRQCLAKAPSDRPPAVAAARVLRTAAGLPPTTLLTGLDNAAVAGPAPADTPTRPATPAPGTGTATRPRRRTLRGTVAALPARYRLAAGGGVLAAAVTAGLLAWPPATPGPQPAAAAAPLSCRVTYATQVATDGDSETAVTVANLGRARIDAWTLSFQLAAGQRLIRGSHATWRQSGAVIEATGRDLGSGEVTRVSFRAASGRSVVLPQSFTVNDVTCAAELSVRGTDERPAAPAVGRTGTVRKEPRPKDPPAARKGNPAKAAPADRAGPPPRRRPA